MPVLILVVGAGRILARSVGCLVAGFVVRLVLAVAVLTAAVLAVAVLTVAVLAVAVLVTILAVR